MYAYLRERVLTYHSYRLYVRPSVQQRISQLCVTFVRCPVESSLAILIVERTGKKERNIQEWIQKIR